MNGHLKIKTFYTVVGIAVMVAVAFGTYVLTRQDDLTKTFNHNFTTVKTDIATMKADISWLRANYK